MRWRMRVSGKSVVEQLKDSPTLLWFAPRLGLDSQQCMELLGLTGTLLSLMTVALPVLRDCRVFLLLWTLYLSLYQVHTCLTYSTALLPVLWGFYKFFYSGCDGLG